MKTITLIFFIVLSKQKQDKHYRYLISDPYGNTYHYFTPDSSLKDTIWNLK